MVVLTYEKFLEALESGVPLYKFRESNKLKEDEYKTLMHQFSMDKEKQDLYRKIKLADAVGMVDDLIVVLQSYALRGVTDERVKGLHISAISSIKDLLTWQSLMLGQIHGVSASGQEVMLQLTPDEYYSQLLTMEKQFNVQT